MLAKLLNRKKAAAAEVPLDASLKGLPVEAAASPDVAPLARESANPVAELVSPSARNDRWDWLVASVCISAGVVGLRTVNDPVLWNTLSFGNPATQPIGTLVKKKGGVRFRSAASPLWHDVYSGSEAVSPGDTVFTGEDGQAELQLLDGSIAEIEPNSLIVVQRSVDVVPDQKGWLGGAFKTFFANSKPESLLRIEQGSTKLVLKKDARALKLQVKGKVYSLASHGEATSAEVSVESKAGQGVSAKFASAEGGSVDLSEWHEGGEASKMEVTSGQQAVLAPGAQLALQKRVVTQLRPAEGEQVLLLPSGALGFAWKWEGAPSTGQKAELEIEGASSKTIAISGGAESEQVSLVEGPYRWRFGVLSETGGRTETPWHSFSIVSLSAPRPIGPLSGAAISPPKGESQASVLLSWSALASGLQAEVEWGIVGSSAQHASSEKSGWQVNLALGSYQWRLRSKAVESGQFSAWTPFSNFSVREEGDAVSVVMAPPAAAPIEPAPPLAPAEPPPIAKPVVAAIKKPARPMAPRKVQRVLTLAHASGSTKLGSADRLDQITIPLKWPSVEDSKQYHVVVTDDMTGKAILDKETRAPMLDLTLRSLASTKFTYQVTAVTRGGEKIQSAPVPIEVQLTAPVLKTPPDGTRIAPNRQNTTLVTWERTVLTDSYRVQISQDPSFHKKVQEENVPRNLLNLHGLTMYVPYYWRVQSISQGHKSDWSTASMFVLEPR